MVEIKKNPNGDTRTAPLKTSYKEFQIANDMHREDVRKVVKEGKVMFEIAMKILETGNKHDWTKKSKEKLFYDDFKLSIFDKSDFTEKEWYNYHINKERHHLLSRCPDDVNLIDVIEMIVDCTCAGLTRSGKTNPVEIDNEILTEAVKNTQRYIEKMVHVVE